MLIVQTLAPILTEMLLILFFYVKMLNINVHQGETFLHKMCTTEKLLPVKSVA